MFTFKKKYVGLLALFVALIVSIVAFASTNSAGSRQPVSINQLAEGIPSPTPQPMAIAVTATLVPEIDLTSASMPTPAPMMMQPTSVPAVPMGSAPQSADNAGSNTNPNPAQTGNSNPNPAQGLGSDTGNHIVIKNATLTLTVENPAATIAEITQVAEGDTGWIVSSNATTHSENGQPLTQAVISIRVPADKFSTVLEQIKKLAFSVDGEMVTGDDVTDQYVDLQSQLGNLQTTQAQLQKIMATATSVNDVLSVQGQLTNVEGQIDQIKGRLQYFSQAAAYSLIAITLNQKPYPATPTPTPTITPSPTVTPTPTVKPFGLSDWHPEQIATSALDTLVGAGQTIVALLIWFVIVGLPVLVLILVITWILRNVIRQLPRRTSPIASQQPPQPPAENG